MNAVETRNVTTDEAGVRLDRWFKRHFPQVGHGHLERLLRTGQIRVDGKRAKASDRLEGGQAIRIPPLGEASETPAKRPPAAIPDKDAAALRAAVLHRDDDVIAINKPAGLAVQGGAGTSRHLDGMLDALRFGSDERPRLVHRLDKDTSGVLLLARNAFAAAKLAEAFRGRDARKIYWAVTVGAPKPERGKIDLPLAKEAGPKGERVAHDAEAGLRAVTYYSVLETLGKEAAFVALWPRTGRTHQLRVHMAATGTPILGDGKYGGQGAFLSGLDVEKRLHLHARRLILPHPRGRKPIDVTAPAPDHLVATCRTLGFTPDHAGGHGADPFEEVE